MHLSGNDNAVLGALFDPETSLGCTAYSEALSTGGDNVHRGYIRQMEGSAIAVLNVASPDVQDIYSSLTALTSIIDHHPDYASAYANRAQARRLLPGSLEDVSMISDILSDLDKAISLATTPISTQHLPSDNLRTLSSAHSHRAYLLMRASTNEEFRDKLLSLNFPLLSSVTDASRQPPSQVGPLM